MGVSGAGPVSAGRCAAGAGGGAQLHGGGQLGDGLVSEHVPRGEPQAGRAGAGDGLDAEDASRRRARRSCRCTPTRATPSTSAQIAASSRPSVSAAPRTRARAVAAVDTVGGGQRAAVHLAAGGQRQARRARRRPRAPCSRAGARRRAARSSAGRRGARSRRRARRRRRAGGGRASSRGDDGGLGDAGRAVQRRLDLAGLDAEAADLDLVVGAAQVLEPCRRAVQRARSPVRYIRLPGAPNGSATNRAAVRPGRPR